MSNKKKVLFICNQNRLRSPTAEKLYCNCENIETKSAGINKDALNQLTSELLEWADIIFVFEKRQRNIIHKRFKEIYSRKQIICLYIPDDYEYMEPTLIELLKEKLKPYIGLPNNI